MSCINSGPRHEKEGGAAGEDRSMNRGMLTRRSASRTAAAAAAVVTVVTVVLSVHRVSTRVSASMCFDNRGWRDSDVDRNRKEKEARSGTMRSRMEPMKPEKREHR